MIKSHHLYPFFPDLIENQRRSVQCFWEKGLLEEFELFSYILGKKKNFQMILHGSKFMLQKPKYTIQEAVRKQKSYSVSLFLPIEFKWYELLPFSHLSHEGGSKEALPPFFPGFAGKHEAGSKTVKSLSRDEKLLSFPSSRFAGSLLLPFGKNGAGKGSTKPEARSKKAEDGNFAAPLDGKQREDSARNEPSSNSSRIIPESVSRPFPVFLGEIPLMTERGTFLINGSARVLVNQIVRCPSVYFKVKIDHKNRRTYIASFLSDYGSWLRLETDYKSRIWVRIDKSQRVSIYALLRSLGFPESFLQYQLKYYSFLFASRETYYTEKPNEAIQYLWKKLTPGRWNSIQGCYAFLYNKFFNPRRYSIGPVGRLRLNKRLNRKLDQRTFVPGAFLPVFPQSGKDGKYEDGKTEILPKASVPYLPTLTPEDVFMALDLLIQLHYGEGYLDDIDHLKNRRVRLPGELIQNQFRLALSRITQIATEKISKFEIEKDLLDRRSLNIKSLASSSGFPQIGKALPVLPAQTGSFICFPSGRPEVRRKQSKEAFPASREGPEMSNLLYYLVQFLLKVFFKLKFLVPHYESCFIQVNFRNIWIKQIH
jgi:DNA-directed RNA polymerase beta subunit